MKKFIVSLCLIFIVIGAVCLGIGLSFDYKKVDTVYINEVVQGLDFGTEPKEIVYHYALIDKTGEVLKSSKDVPEMAIETRLSKALADGDIVVDYGDKKIIFYTESNARFYSMRNTLIWIVEVSFVVLGLAMAIGCYFIYKHTVKPFNSLKSFAQEVAKGNLDSPLILDKYMSFGAFGEAFDIMRNNLRESRIAEQSVYMERRRLLQEIGHEIKTPLSTIKAVAECGFAVDGNENYTVISNKANAIDNLVNDFYQKALEEEGQLNVFITKHSQEDFKKLISECDYNGKIVLGEDINCNILYDKNRMIQIVDNIIANSYKYADTDISVKMRIEDEKLKVTFKDYGDGVVPEQLSYIMDRFYRGEKTEEKLGQGLGLNICRKLVIRMGGDMNCYNDNGFVVELILPVMKSFEQ